MLSVLRNSIFLMLVSLPFLASSVNGQTIQRVSGTSARDFQVRVTNSFGVRTSINVTPNVRAQNSANVVLMPGSSISDSFGDSNGNANANFTVSPNGGNMNVNGIQSVNTFVFGEGTQFQSTTESVENPDPNYPIEGTASSMAVHELNLTIQNQQSQFGNSFSQSF